MQDELTKAIVAELEPTLRGTATSVASQRRGTEDAEAYEHYLRGRYYWERRGEPGLMRALGEFRAAIARDSSFARAWAGMALVYVVLPSYASLDPDSITNFAFATARRALAIDSSLAEAHLALANAFVSLYQFPESDAEFRRALALAPNDPTTHQWRASLLHGRGRVDDAFAENRRAGELDPLSAVILADRAGILMSLRRYPEAFAAARRALELDSTFTYSRFILGELHGLTGHPDSALLQLGLEPPGSAATAWRGPGWRGISAWAYGIARRPADVARMRHQIAREPGVKDGYDAGMAAMALGDLEGTVSAFSRSLKRHELLPIETSPSCNPVFEPLHALESYRKLMAQYEMRICEQQ